VRPSAPEGGEAPCVPDGAALAGRFRPLGGQPVAGTCRSTGSQRLPATSGQAGNLPWRPMAIVLRPQTGEAAFELATGCLHRPHPTVPYEAACRNGIVSPAPAAHNPENPSGHPRVAHRRCRLPRHAAAACQSGSPLGVAPKNAIWTCGAGCVRLRTHRFLGGTLGTAGLRKLRGAWARTILAEIHPDDVDGLLVALTVTPMDTTACVVMR
jgi:hypothetical protein